MNTPDIALAALIIACIAMVGSLISDSILLAEYSAYVDTKDRVKTLLNSKAEIALLRDILQAVVKKMADSEAETADAQGQPPATSGQAKMMWDKRHK